MSDIFSKIEQLKRDRNAVILSHYYQDPDIQDVADFMGDSLALAQYAIKTNADVILFCGVHFMCETAKILNPEKTVILPDLDAGCSLADSALETLEPQINMPGELRLRALKPLERMLALS